MIYDLATIVRDFLAGAALGALPFAVVGTLAETIMRGTLRRRHP